MSPFFPFLLAGTPSLNSIVAKDNFCQREIFSIKVELNYTDSSDESLHRLVTATIPLTKNQFVDPRCLIILHRKPVTDHVYERIFN